MLKLNKCMICFKEHFVVNREKQKEVKSQVFLAKQVLEKWKLSYFENRAEIEKLGRSSRWEFDREKLFKMSDYMASVCQDIHNVFQVRYMYALLDSD